MRGVGGLEPHFHPWKARDVNDLSTAKFSLIQLTRIDGLVDCKVGTVWVYATADPWLQG